MERGRKVGSLMQVSPATNNSPASSSVDQKMVGSSRWTTIQSWPPLLWFLCSVTNMNTSLFLSEEEICKESVVTARGEAGILSELGLLHIADSFGLSSRQQPHVVIQLERHGILCDAMDGIDISGS